MNKLIYILITILLITPILILAVKPTPQISTGTYGISIAYIKAQAFKYGEDFDFYLHLFNLTNSMPLTNSSNMNISCYLHIYNETDNEHIYKGKFNYDSVDTYDWELEINHTIFAKTGFYPYIVFCNSSGYGGGFVSDELLISVDGEGELASISTMFLIAVILIPLIFAWFLFSWVSSLNDEHSVLKLGVSLFSLFMVVVSLWFSTIAVLKFFLWNAMVNALSISTKVIVVFLGVIIIYWMIWFIVKVFNGIAEQRKERRGLE